jgi:hypothetical protein
MTADELARELGLFHEVAATLSPAARARIESGETPRADAVVLLQHRHTEMRRGRRNARSKGPLLYERQT